MTDHEGGDMSDDIPNWDWVSIEEKDAEIAKLKAELEEAREVIQGAFDANARRVVVAAMINGDTTAKLPDWMEHARAFLDKAGK